MPDEFRQRALDARKKKAELTVSASKQLDTVMINEIELMRKEIRELRAELRSEVGRIDRKFHSLKTSETIDA